MPFFSTYVGVKGATGTTDTGTQVLLQVAGLFKDIPISMLSDENFTEVIGRC